MRSSGSSRSRSPRTNRKGSRPREYSASECGVVNRAASGVDPNGSHARPPTIRSIAWRRRCSRRAAAAIPAAVAASSHAPSGIWATTRATAGSGSGIPLILATRTVRPPAVRAPVSSASIRQPGHVEPGTAMRTGTERPDPSSESTRAPRSNPSHRPPARARAATRPPVRWSCSSSRPGPSASTTSIRIRAGACPESGPMFAASAVMCLRPGQEESPTSADAVEGPSARSGRFRRIPRLGGHHRRGAERRTSPHDRQRVARNPAV